MFYVQILEASLKKIMFASCSDNFRVKTQIL